MYLLKFTFYTLLNNNKRAYPLNLFYSSFNQSSNHKAKMESERKRNGPHQFDMKSSLLLLKAKTFSIKHFFLKIQTGADIL